MNNIKVTIYLALSLVAIFFFAIQASADVKIIGQSPIYKTIPLTEQVKVCSEGKKGTGFDLGSGIIGGIIGNNIGNNGDNTAAGIIIGGLLGGQDKPSTCHYETRTTGSKTIHDGYNITLDVDGQIRTMRISK